MRPYFRTRLDGLGYEEWPDGFDFENIPETVIDKSYHLEVGNISTARVDQTMNDINYPIAVRIYLKGFRDPAEAIDEAVSQGEAIICDVTKVVNANAQGIKDVRFESFQPIAKSDNNDNIILLDMAFVAKVILDRR